MKKGLPVDGTGLDVFMKAHPVSNIIGKQPPPKQEVQTDPYIVKMGDRKKLLGEYNSLRCESPELCKNRELKEATDTRAMWAKRQRYLIGLLAPQLAREKRLVAEGAIDNTDAKNRNSALNGALSGWTPSPLCIVRENIADLRRELKPCERWISSLSNTIEKLEKIIASWTKEKAARLKLVAETLNEMEKGVTQEPRIKIDQFDPNDRHGIKGHVESQTVRGNASNPGGLMDRYTPDARN